MATIRMSVTVGADGVLRLSVPVGSAGEFDVVVSPKPVSADPKAPEGLGWPPGYFESMFGSIDDDNFVAPPRLSAKHVPPLDGQ